ncbi:acyl carrier protein [Methylococcus sp. Mc7]|uniref:acyl carrier protein n=1 Tax=Methylococcus sp. Mc7 TaxID=2860258 RepID=UPI001C527363|nr:acyl carrier protein [Methylococcus sp. Mc7]QXP84192.1 acyl carrier protein [Methylococcus sp. Mc7]
MLFTEDEHALQDDDSFINEGIIDSTGVLELIFFIEDTFNIKVNYDEILPTNLDSVEKMVDFVTRKQAAAD